MTPNHRKFRNCPREADELRPVPIGPLLVYPAWRPVDEPEWMAEIEPTYHEREKQSSGILHECLARKMLETP